MTDVNVRFLEHPATQQQPKDDTEWQYFIRALVDGSSSPTAIDSALAEYSLLLPTPVDATLRTDINILQTDVTTLQTDVNKVEMESLMATDVSTNVARLQEDVNKVEMENLMGIYG